MRQNDLTIEDFGRSTRYFPLVGAILGFIYACIALVLMVILGSQLYTVRTVLVLLPLLLSGGIHCDGFMDTMDGLFSGRGRERMLEIMKDSRAGSFGVAAFVCLLLFDWSLIFDLQEPVLVVALFVMPVIGRMAMLFAVGYFPYARPEGMGKAFADMTDHKAIAIGLLITLIFVVPVGIAALLALLCGVLWAFLFGCFARKKLGGLTGDVYGAIEMTTETVVLVIFFLCAHLPIYRGALFLWM